ncbi:hypothetical protein JOY44_14630 [Phormidium sp. CLA17]|uniref:hypothetical protein n=1 Tax=Leptolyngbya sp. Cla-17 TaxID=2803751 RepID=UPI001492E358|nr:hypothetical protein [Leptolyngbya sp. Cla-17]MBM0742829.1 hypothetical protein [Leptolyngbya sp. Cla-17]
MEKHMCSGDSGNDKNEQGDRDLLSALFHAEGIHCTGTADQPFTEDAVQVEDLPGAKISYPWNPCDPESEGFYVELEQASFLDGWQESEIATRANSFFAQIDRQWSSTNLQTSLAQRFSTRIPRELLASIAAQAQKLVAESRKAVAESLSLADQLVQCIQEVAINLGQEDLYVQARLLEPMRNGGLETAVDNLLTQIPQTEWSQLSEIQKARLSLAIARCAIDELQSPTE